jgi:hypothetical protein
LAIACFLGCLPGCRRGQAQSAASRYPFADVTARAGVHFRHQNGQGGGANIVETTGAGCAFFDYDNDGWLDIYLVNGKSPPGDGNRLFHNNRDGTFTDVTGTAGVQGLRHGVGMGCAVGDYNADGYLDLYVTYWGENSLYRNNGNGTFTDVTRQAGVRAGGFSTAATFADLDGDGWPDLYVARYCLFNSRSRQLCAANGVPTSCPPYYYPPEPDVVYRNLGNGRFQDVTGRWGMQDTTGRGLGVVAVDYDRDGLIDLFVANDGSPNFLYRNLGGGHFRNVAATEGIALNDTGSAVANMGCDFGDYVGDGTFGAVTGVFQREVHPIWKYSPGIGFEHMSRRAGLQDATLQMLTFGIGFADLNNDGWLDLFLANGHVQDHIAEIDRACTYRQARAYFENTGKGTFVNRSAACGPALTTPEVGRGLSFGDFDNDGRVDLLVNNNNGPAMLIRNQNPPRNWVELRLVGKGRNWEATGAVVDLYAGGRRFTRFVHANYSFASASDPRLHFGLGPATSIERVEIRWPDGQKSRIDGPPANRLVNVVEPGAQPPAPVRRLLD